MANLQGQNGKPGQNTKNLLRTEVNNRPVQNEIVGQNGKFTGTDWKTWPGIQ